MSASGTAGRGLDSSVRSNDSPHSTALLVRSDSARATSKDEYKDQSPSRLLGRSGSSSIRHDLSKPLTTSPAKLTRSRSAVFKEEPKDGGSVVKFQDNGEPSEKTYIEKQVSNLLKSGKSPKKPTTPTRQSRKKLSELMRKFDTSSPSLEEGHTM
jgi:hypothetical protein